MRWRVRSRNYILGKFDISGESLLKSLGCLDPDKIKSPESVQDIVKVANSLPTNVNIDHVMDEWKLLQLEDFKNSGDRIDHYWDIILKKKVDQKFKYNNLVKIIKPAMTLIHGSADVERGFSRSARIMTEERASMSFRMLNARLIVSDGLKQYNNKPESVPITKKLLHLASVAYKNYNNYLEEEKRRLEEASRKAKEADELKAANEKEIANLDKKKENIKSLTAELKAAKKEESFQNEISDQLLDEANQRLKKALHKSDYAEAKKAQNIIEGVMLAKAENKKKRKHVECMEKKLEKKTNSLITNFLNKKPRTES